MSRGRLVSFLAPPCFPTRLRFGPALLCLLVPASQPRTAQESACDEPAAAATYLFLGSSAQCQIQPNVSIPFGANRLLTVSVSASTTPVSALRFTLPDPPVGSIHSLVWNFPHVGNAATGVELELPECVSGNLLLGEIVLEVPVALSACEFWGMSSGAEAEDCQGQVYAVAPWHQFLNETTDCIGACASWQWCALFPPEALLPADDTTDLPLDTQPSVNGNHLAELHITADPACAAFDVFPPDSNQPWLPAGYLQAGTTYYWYVLPGPVACSNIGDLRSRTQSFTTAPVVAAERHPWSRVKSLFR